MSYSNPAIRATGRTHRMLEHAKQLDREGRKVHVITNEKDELKSRLGAEIGGIKVESFDLYRFDLKTMRIRGADLNHVVLIDHFVIETEFAEIIKMLHRYDPSLPQPRNPHIKDELQS